MYYQIDYFVVFHGKRELSERSFRKRPNSKLKWVINHRNWTIMRTNNDRFLLMFLLLCIWSEMYHLRYRLTEIDMKWQATNCWRSNSIGYKIKLFYGHFTRCQNPFGIEYFGTVLIRLPFHLFHVSRNSCITSHKTIAKLV